MDNSKILPFAQKGSRPGFGGFPRFATAYGVRLPAVAAPKDRDVARRNDSNGSPLATPHDKEPLK